MINATCYIIEPKIIKILILNLFLDLTDIPLSSSRDVYTHLFQFFSLAHLREKLAGMYVAINDCSGLFL